MQKIAAGTWLALPSDAPYEPNPLAKVPREICLELGGSEPRERTITRTVTRVGPDHKQVIVKEIVHLLEEPPCH